MSFTTRVVTAMLVGVIVASCSPPGPQGQIRMYHRNAADQPLGIRTGETWTRVGGTGCHGVAAPWTMSIGPAGPDGAEGNYAQLLSSEDVEDPLNVEIWIDAAEDGTVSWGLGMPDWADGPAPECGRVD